MLKRSTAAIALLLAGCTAGGSRPVPLAPGHAPDAMHPNATSAVLRIKIPTPKPGTARPHYVSPASESGALDVTPLQTCKGCSKAVHLEFGLTSGTAGCKNSAAMRVCNEQLALNPGTYTGSLTIFDGPLANGNVSGNALSIKTSFPIKIVAGQQNTIGAATNGIPSGLAWAYLSGPAGTFVDQKGRLRIPGVQGVAQVAVYALDADGYAIVPSNLGTLDIYHSGGIPFTAKQVAGSNVVVITSPKKPKHEDSFPDDGFIFTMKAPICSQPHANCKGFIELKIEQFLAVIDPQEPDVYVYTVDGTYIGNVPFTSIKYPSSARFDSRGNLWVADPFQNNVKEYAYPYNQDPITTIPIGVLNSIDGSLAFDSKDDLAILTASGVELHYPPTYNGLSSKYAISIPYAVAFDSLNNLYMTSSDGKIRKFAPPQFISSPYTTTLGQTSLWFLQVENDGPFQWVYAGAKPTGKLWYLDSSLNVQQTASAGGAIDAIWAEQGDFMVVQSAANKFLDYSLPNMIFYGSTTSDMQAPKGLALDGDHRIVTIQSTPHEVTLLSFPDFGVIERYYVSPETATALTLWP